ncbi:MAG: hypothetical protein IKR18_04400 [Bacteroidaceae bacterium]|nr:hypothetical protein [Bacteroidaceae bacterium]
MKRNTIITFTIIAYFIALIAMFFCVNQYIDTKDQRLRGDIEAKIDKVFENKREYVYVAYSGQKVGYERMRIPSKPSKEHKSLQDTWNENYGDLTKLYRIHYRSSDWKGLNQFEDGWNLITLERDLEGVSKTWIFPYAVGYKKQEDPWLYDYAPDVSEAVHEAFEFYTKNEKSSFYDSFDKGSIDDVELRLICSSNEYYYLSKDKYPRATRMGLSLPCEPFKTMPNYYQNGYMHNGYYKVFIACTQPQTYTIKKREGNPDDKDREDLWLYWSIGLTALMLTIVIPLAFIQRKHEKEKEESCYDKLIRLCNPANFIKKDCYDKDKIDKANKIYKKLLEISPDDKDALNAIQLQAISELNINLINHDRLKELKEKVNPKKYINPYNAEKVALANELYAIISKEDLTYSEFVEVEERSKSL